MHDEEVKDSVRAARINGKYKTVLPVSEPNTANIGSFGIIMGLTCACVNREQFITVRDRIVRGALFSLP